jgi:hypothetical protein
LSGVVKRGNGSTVYAWFIYRKGRSGNFPRLSFASP